MFCALAMSGLSLALFSVPGELPANSSINSSSASVVRSVFSISINENGQSNNHQCERYNEYASHHCTSVLKCVEFGLPTFTFLTLSAALLTTTAGSAI